MTAELAFARLINTEVVTLPLMANVRFLKMEALHEGMNSRKDRISSQVFGGATAGEPRQVGCRDAGKAFAALVHGVVQDRADD